VSVFYPIIGALEAPTSLLLTTTSVTDVLTMAAGRQDIVTIIGIVIANADAAPIAVSVWWTEDATDHLIFIGDVPAGETITEALKHPIRFNATSTARKIRAQASTGSMITVSVFNISVNVQATR
jgi:hypothetical protein